MCFLLYASQQIRRWDIVSVGCLNKRLQNKCYLWPSMPTETHNQSACELEPQRPRVSRSGVSSPSGTTCALDPPPNLTPPRKGTIRALDGPYPLPGGSALTPFKSQGRGCLALRFFSLVPGLLTSTVPSGKLTPIQTTIKTYIYNN